MAITIVSNFTSGKFYPSANPINVTVNSSNSGKCNFRYICDLYINGVKSYTDKIFPDPNTGYGFFQLSRVISDYISTNPINGDLPISSLAASTSVPSAALSVYCKFGEEYIISANCEGPVLQYPNLSTSSVFYVYEAAFDYEDFPSYDEDVYLVKALGVESNSKFLTNSPREVELTYNDPYYLDFISDELISTGWKLNFDIYNDDGSEINSYWAITTLTKTRRYRLSIGPYNLNRVYSYPLINLRVKSYRVYLTYNDVKQSEYFNFKIREPKAFITTIGFTGLLGSPENFTFYHRNLKTFNLERKTFERSIGSNKSGTWRYDVGDRGTTTYGIKANESHKVSTYCSRDISEWLYEMWLSPNVWTYRKSNLTEITIFNEGDLEGIESIETRILIRLTDASQYSVGDYIMILPEYIPGINMNGRYEIIGIEGNVLDLGFFYAGFPIPRVMCGLAYKDSSFDILPITISDNNIEVKQKLTKPIEYSLSYNMAYQKTTLKG